MVTQATTLDSSESGQHDGSSHFIALVLSRRVRELEEQMAEHGERQKAFETRINGLVAEAVQTMYIAMQGYEEKTNMFTESMEQLNDRFGSLQTESQTQPSQVTNSTALIPAMMYDSSSPSSLLRTERTLEQFKSELTASDVSLKSEFTNCLKTISEFQLGNFSDSIPAACSGSEAGARNSGVTRSYSVPATFFKGTAPCDASDKPTARGSTAVDQKGYSDLHRAAFTETVKGFSSYPDSGVTQWAASITPRTTSQAPEPAPAELGQCMTAISAFQSHDFQAPIQINSSSSTAGACSAGVARAYSAPCTFRRQTAPCRASDKLMARDAFTVTVKRFSSYPDSGVTQRAASLTPRTTSQALEPAPAELGQSMIATSMLQSDESQAPIQKNPSNSTAGACSAAAPRLGFYGTGTPRRSSLPAVNHIRSGPSGGSALAPVVRGNKSAVLQKDTVKGPSDMHQAAFTQPLERFPSYPGPRVMHEVSRVTSVALNPWPVQAEHGRNVTVQSPRGMNLSPRSPRSPRSPLSPRSSRSTRAQLPHSASVACITPRKSDERFVKRVQDSDEPIVVGLSRIRFEKQTNHVSVKKTCML